jgi:DNA anti-recombination protein RmuC
MLDTKDMTERLRALGFTQAQAEGLPALLLPWVDARALHPDTLKAEAAERRADIADIKIGTQDEIAGLRLEMQGFRAHVDLRLQEMEQRFEKRFHAIDQKFENRFHEMDKKFENRFHAMDQKMESRFHEMNMRFGDATRTMLKWFIGTQLATIGTIMAMGAILVSVL